MESVFGTDSSAIPALLMAMLDELTRSRESQTRVGRSYVKYREQMYRRTYQDVDKLISEKLDQLTEWGTKG